MSTPLPKPKCLNKNHINSRFWNPPSQTRVNSSHQMCACPSLISAATATMRPAATPTSARNVSEAVTTVPPRMARSSLVIAPLLSIRLSCRSLRSSGRGPPTVHHQIDAGHKTRIIAGKKQRRARHVVGHPEPRPWRPPMRAIQHSGIDRTAGGAGLDLARRHGVADDALGGIIGRDLPGQVSNRRLRRAISNVVRRGDESVLRGQIHDPPPDLATPLLGYHLPDGRAATQI